jgi:hypothetical protein
MNKIYASLVLIFFLSSTQVFAGNPDRQGEAGAYELLINPWARSAGLHSITTSMVSGVEAMQINVAGLGRINSTQFVLSNTQYFVGTGISLNGFGFAHKMGKGTIGLSLVAMNLGNIQVTTTDAPEGNGATYSPSFFNIGLSYAHTFDNKVSVGILVRGISQSTAELSSFGIAIDAGVQYVTGENDNFKFGIALRNVGSRMRFGGEGLSTRRPNPGDEEIPYQVTYDTRAASFEMPSLLNIGVSYDFYAGKNHRITTVGNFTSNSFSRDQVGAGLEYSLREMFMLRAGYLYDLGSSTSDVTTRTAYTGLSAGISFEFPLGRDSETKFGIDYAYRATNPFNGTHNLAVRINL